MAATYELDSEQPLLLDIPLRVNEAATDELGPGEDRDHAVVEEELRSFYSSIQVQPLRFGIFGSIEASLMVLDLTFQASKPQKYRFRSAEIIVSMIGDRGGEAADSSPTIIGFEPEAAYGRPVGVIDERGWTVEAKTPIYDVLKVTGHKSKQVERAGRFAIFGSGRGNPINRILWSMDEGEGTQSGLPHNIKTAILFSATAPFNLRFDISTDIGFLPSLVRSSSKLAKTIAALWSGETSIPVNIDVAKIRERQKVKGAQSETFDLAMLAAFTSFTQPPSE